MTYAHYRISTGSGPRRLVAIGIGIVVPVLSIIALDQGLKLNLVEKLVDLTAVKVDPTPPAPAPPAPPPPGPGTYDPGKIDVAPPIITVEGPGEPSTTAPTGGAYTPARSLASNGVSVYPDAARRACEQGTVRLNLQIGADGRVTDASIASSSGYPALDDAALRAARAWRFTPARRDGTAVETTIVQPVKFDLKNEIGVSMTAAEVRECLKG